MASQMAFYLKTSNRIKSGGKYPRKKSRRVSSPLRWKEVLPQLSTPPSPHPQHPPCPGKGSGAHTTVWEGWVSSRAVDGRMGWVEGKGPGRAARRLGRGDRCFHTSLHKRTLSRSPAEETTGKKAFSTPVRPLGKGPRFVLGPRLSALPPGAK